MQNVKNNFSLERDHLKISDLQIACKVGCSKEERAFPQVLSLTMLIFLPLKPSADSDDLTKSVDYAQIIADIKNLLPSQEFQLIETIAEKCADLILRHSKVQTVCVEVSKKVFPDVDSISCVIWRSKTS